MNQAISNTMNDNPGWSCFDTDIVTCNRRMLEQQVACDVDFLLQEDDGSETVVKAHKYVLMSRSPVFLAMFNGPCAESSRQLAISDVTPLAFKAMLR